MEYFLVNVLGLVCLDVALHCDSTDLAGNTEDTLVKNEAGAVTELLSAGYRIERNALVCTKSASLPELVHHILRNVCREVADSLNVLRAANESALIHISSVLNIKSRLLHSYLCGHCSRNSDIVVSAGSNSCINLVEYILIQSIVECCESILCDKSDGLPAVSGKVSKRNVSFYLLVRPCRLKLSNIKERTLNVTALSCVISYKCVLRREYDALIVIIIADRATVKHRVEKLVRSVVDLFVDNCGDESGNLVVSIVTHLAEFLEVCVDLRSSFCLFLGKSHLSICLASKLEYVYLVYHLCNIKFHIVVTSLY